MEKTCPFVRREHSDTAGWGMVIVALAVFAPSVSLHFVSVKCNESCSLCFRLLGHLCFVFFFCFEHFSSIRDSICRTFPAFFLQPLTSLFVVYPPPSSHSFCYGLVYLWVDRHFWLVLSNHIVAVTHFLLWKCWITLLLKIIPANYVNYYWASNYLPIALGLISIIRHFDLFSLHENKSWQKSPLLTLQCVLQKLVG